MEKPHVNAEPLTDMRAPGHRNHGFMVGFMTGSVIGAGLAMYVAPRTVSALRRRLAASAARVREMAAALGDNATERYQQASTRVGETVDTLTRKGQDVRDDVADAVVHGAHEVERYATAAKTERAVKIRNHSAADRSASRERTRA
jgi:gas vesicle protein